MSQELVCSLPINSNINNSNVITENAVNRWGGLASIIITWSAMLMQGLLAFLLFNLFLKHAGKRVLSPLMFELLNWGGGILILLFAIAGKAVIVNSYNYNTFIELAQSIKELFQSPREWFAAKRHALTTLTWKDTIIAIPNAAMTINVSLIFGIGITHLSFTKTSTLLLEDYSSSVIRLIALYCSKLYVMAFFMTCSMLCNLLGFPYIHNSSVGKIFQFLNRMFENSTVRLWKAELTRAIQTVSRRWERIIAYQNKQRMAAFLNTLFNINPENRLSLEALDTTKVEEILKLPIDAKGLLSLRQMDNPCVDPVYWDETIVTRGVGLAATALTMAGLYNFRQMGVYTFELLGISSPFFQNSAGIAAFISMSLMAIDAVLQPTVDLIANALFARDYICHSLYCSTRFMLGLLLLFSMLLGGFPNGYQEHTVGGNTTSIAIALFSSAMLEVYAMYMLVYSYQERKNLSNNPLLHLANGISKKIQAEIDKLENMSPEQIKELEVDIHPDKAQQILNTALEHASWKWIKKSTQNIGSCLTSWYSKHQRFSTPVVSEQLPLLLSPPRKSLN